MKYFFMSLFLLVTLCACQQDNDLETVQSTRTVIVYMAGENNLSNNAGSDLEEMKAGSVNLTNQQNLIVYVDRAYAKTTPYLARVKNGELCDTVYMPEGVAADPDVMERVIRKAKQLYPADSYGLVLWGHCSGWLIKNSEYSSGNATRAYAGSNNDNTANGCGKYWMNIPQMSSALTRAMGADKFDFIFGDCCCFASIEVAYELRNITNYVIGSPAEVPDTGGPFEKLVPAMFNSSSQFYQYIIDSYFDAYLDVWGYSIPLAAISTSQIENLVYATADILHSMPEKVSSDGNLDLEHITFYGVYSDINNGIYHFSYVYSYDMCSVLKKNAAPSDYEAWLQAFQQAVPYHRHSNRWLTVFNSLQLSMELGYFKDDAKNCGDVGMFFPNTLFYSTSPNWNKAIQLYQFNDIINWQQYGW